MLGERQPSPREASDLIKKSAEELIGRSAGKSPGRMGKGSTSSHEEDLLENDDEGKLSGKGGERKRNDGNRARAIKMSLRNFLGSCLHRVSYSSRPAMKELELKAKSTCWSSIVFPLVSLGYGVSFNKNKSSLGIFTLP